MEDRSGGGKRPGVPGEITLREAVEENERRRLAPYAVRSAGSRGRRHAEASQPFRSAFQLDRDRIIHSTAFRRLEYKTQVFVNHEGDHYRTRLTHSLEVAQISRSVARLLGLNEDLIEAIALSHDLGHAPFGHAGESALDRLMAAHGGFNHNQHGLRVVDHLEVRYPAFRGLNLTWEVREAIVKHGREEIAGVPAAFMPAWQPSLEAQIADVADSIAYDNHDMDDGLRAGYLCREQLEELALWRRARELVHASYGSELAERIEVARTVSRLIHLEVTDLVESTARTLAACGVQSVEDVHTAGRCLARFSPDMERMQAEVKAFLYENLYRHYRAVAMAEKAKRFITALFEEYVRNPAQLPPEYRLMIPAEGTETVVCDYLAGMTDRFCQEEYSRLFQPFERM
jgi:dGTPase